MIALPPEIRFALRANDLARRAARLHRRAEPDPMPVLKLLNPIGPAVWIATELAADGDTLFGIADLGFGSPESGHFSLSAIGAVHLPCGFRIEHDSAFRPRFPLSVYAEAARIAGRISEAESLLATVARARDHGTPRNPEIPSRSDG